MTTITLPIEIILTEGLQKIKDSLTRDKIFLTNGYGHYTELHGIFDDLQHLIQDPLDYVQEIVGYIEDFEEEALEDLNNIERAMLFLSRNQERWAEVNDLLKQMLPNFEEFKELNAVCESHLSKY